MIEVAYICREKRSGKLQKVSSEVVSGFKQENMKIAAANKKLDAIIEKVEKEGVQAAGLVDDLKELREYVSDCPHRFFGFNVSFLRARLQCTQGKPFENC